MIPKFSRKVKGIGQICFGQLHLEQTQKTGNIGISDVVRGWAWRAMPILSQQSPTLGLGYEFWAATDVFIFLDDALEDRIVRILGAHLCQHIHGLWAVILIRAAQGS